MSTPSPRSVTILRDGYGEEIGRIVDDRDLAAMSDSEYDDFLVDEMLALDEEVEREQARDVARMCAAAADYVRIHLGTAIRALEHEKQMLHALKADVLETQMVVRELAVA